MELTPLLDCAGLAVGYGRRAVLREVTLSVAPGEVLCLLGPNGCGKTTLFKTLLGLLPPLDGAIRLKGDPLALLTRRARARRAAYVPQATTPSFPFSALELVTMGRTARLGPFAQPGRADEAAARAALARLGVEDLAERSTAALSGGQRQLVLIARALAQEAPLLVMDEPTASLDFGNEAQVLDQATRLAADGFGVVLSTHDPDQAFAIADRAALIAEGRVLALGPPAEVLTPAALQRVYGVPVSVARLEDGRLICAPNLRRRSDRDAQPPFQRASPHSETS